MVHEFLDTTMVGEIVATNFRTAGVFERFGIDFCCGGRRSLADACRAAAADPRVVRQALNALTPTGRDDDADVTRWSVDRLIDHIVSTHHAYVRFAMPTIAHRLGKLIDAHGERHPELARIAAAFDTLQRELQQHLMKEEHVLFPYIRQLAKPTHRPSPSPFGTVANPIRMMEREHRAAGDELGIVRALTNDYTPPADGCTTYRVCFAELAQFERDLHQHVHLENNVLFPKALALEESVLRSSLDALTEEKL